MRWTILTILLPILGPSTAARADTAEDHQQCFKAEIDDQSEWGCSRVIENPLSTPLQKADAYRIRGLYKIKKGDGDLAIDDLNQAILLNPNDAEAFAARARGHIHRMDLVLAVQDFDVAIRLSPGQAEWHANRGLLRKVTKDPVGAIADYTEALRLKPREERYFMSRGHVHADSGDPASAIADYSEALAITPSDSAFSLRGDQLAKLARYALAIADYTEAIKLAPDRYYAFVKRGEARFATGDLVAARADAEAALARKSDDRRSEDLLRKIESAEAAATTP